MNKTKFGLLTTLVITLSVGFGALRGATHQSVSAQKQEPTEKQKEHRKLYKEYKREQTLPVLAETATSDITVIEGVGQKVFQPDGPRLGFQTFIKHLSCHADAIVIGVINNKASQLTENEAFTFTDYEMSVEDVLKNNPASPIQKNTSITLTRPGGTVLINGRRITAVDEAFKPLDVGERYLLFLQFIPQTRAYKSSGGADSYQLKNNRTIKLTEESLPPELETVRESGAFITDIRNNINGGCNN